MWEKIYVRNICENICEKNICENICEKYMWKILVKNK